mmetsp:Transcript_19868/g.36074  ORF Transcript_19868/g.36074 Transcript_19868/m.36074 type:complete len:232 (-) Transcript_19868:136-831(-)
MRWQLLCALALLWNKPGATSFAWNHQSKLRIGNATSNSTVSPTPVPSVAPGGNATNTTAPTAAPSVQVTNVTQTPTAAPSVEAKNVTQAPTLVPTNATNAPTTQPVGPLPTNAPTRAYTTSPTTNGTDNGGDHHHHKKGPTVAKLIAKTLGWFVLIFLSGLVFAAGVSQKERIFYLLKECWYRVRQSGFTRWLARKFRRGGGRSDNSLSEVVFDSSDADGMSEPFLLRDGL